MGETIIKIRMKTGSSWTVERQPAGIKDPMVVRFACWTPKRCRLDQTARWTPTDWDPDRWVPRPPVVPKAIIEKVEAHMRGLQP